MKTPRASWAKPRWIRRSRASGLIVVLVLLALLGSVQNVGAAPSPFTRLGTGCCLATDRGRFITYLSRPGVLRVRDGSGRRTRTLRLPKGCYPRGAGSGRLLLSCEGEVYRRVFRLALVNLRDGRIRDVRGQDDLAGGAWAVGRYWTGGEASYTSSGYDLEYLNWRTGEIRYRVDDDRNPELVDPIWPELDTPDLRPLPYDCSRQRADSRRLPQVLLSSGGELSAGRCAARRRVVLERGAGTSSEQVSHGWVTWISGRRLKVYLLASGGRSSWALPRGVGASPLAWAVHSDTEVLVTRYGDRDNLAGRYGPVFVARRPR